MQPEKPRRRQQDLILDHLTALTNKEIRRFLKRHKIAGASVQAKDELRRILRDALKAEQISTKSVVRFLDEVTPWGKQHVYLYTGPSAKDWRNEKWVMDHFKAHDLLNLLNAATDTIVLPEELQLACIHWSKQRLRITAVRKREGWVRSEEHDNKKKKTPEGRPLWLKGYVYQVLRGITAFEWNLVSNEAFLQITQLPGGQNYETIADEFRKAVEPWLDLGTFKAVDLRPAVKKLHELEEQGKGTAHSHAMSFARLGQRHVDARSSSSRVPLFGDRVVDGVLKMMREGGIPRIGDYFFDENGNVGDGDGKPQARWHVIIMAEQGRINFATPIMEQGVRNVLNSLRTLGK